MPAQMKYDLVSELRDKLSGAEAVFVCEYRGLTVAQMTDIRRKIREAGGEMKVAKNTLVGISLKELEMACPEEIMVGPNIYTIASNDSPAVAKALKEFAANNKALVIKGGVMGSDSLNVAQVMALADLPSKDQLIAQVVGTIAAPLRGLVTVLSGTTRGFVTCLSQIADKKKEAA